MKFERKKIAVALAYALGAGSTLLIAAPSQAADISVSVTGSNIPRTEIEGNAPIQVLTSEDLVRSGYTTVSEVLRDITSNGQGMLGQGFAGAFAGGASGVALRGLTVGATLTLIDGMRMVPYPLGDDGQRNFVDISSIPFSAIERIEVLLDGASAIYGSDAIGGVVNVILKKSFTGLPGHRRWRRHLEGRRRERARVVRAGFRRIRRADVRHRDGRIPASERDLVQQSFRQGLGQPELAAVRGQRHSAGRL